MVQGMLSFEPETTRLRPGMAVEWFLIDRGYWRTAEYVRTIKRGRRLGMIEVRPTAGVPKSRLFVRPDHVKPIGTPA